MSADPLKTYLQALQKELDSGYAGEHAHRPALKVLLEALLEGGAATNEPNQITDCGKPDMVVTRGPVLIGYLETKDLGANLAIEENSEQIRRYRNGLPNFVLTNYLEFCRYVDGKLRDRKSLGTRKGDRILAGPKADLMAVREFLDNFLVYRAPAISSPEDLAARMAALARLMRDAAAQTLDREPETGALRAWWRSFEKTLAPGLDSREFADMYAQTLTYGLFAAKVTMGSGKELRRETAALLLPETNPFLKKLFWHLGGPEVPPTVSWVIDDLIHLLNNVQWDGVLQYFGKGSLEQDPVVHFYETFLARYDPAKRERRGVYYTPEPVVSYIVRSIDHLLKERFDRALGLADTNTLILDPACGTGTFLHSVIALICQTLTALGQSGGLSDYLGRCLLPRVFGFELLMAPYAVAHLKLGLQLKQMGYDFASGQRLGVFLTNTLSEALKWSPELAVAGFIAEESAHAARIKKEDPIEVVLGNPPYSGHSANSSWVIDKGKKELTFIGKLIRDYYQVDGQPLKEQNPKLLQDDYVKFLRWGQWRIGHTGRGILAMITNHGYLDNPTFRGMRQQLINSFDEIYVFNLHGNTRKKERCPDGSKDDNVFDIQQGVAIGIFLKLEGNSREKAVVRYADLWGSRQGKYDWLAENTVMETTWQTLEPQSPHYLFIPQDTSLQEEYESFWKVTDIFPLYSTGVKTHRDHFAFDFEMAALRQRIEDFKNLKLSDDEILKNYDLKDTRDWKLKNRRLSLAKENKLELFFTTCLYRPFDVRNYFHHIDIVELPRSEVMYHFFRQNNMGLIATRSTKDKWDIFITKLIADHKSMAAFDTNYIFPLYIYPTDIFKYNEKLSNFNKGFLDYLSGLWKFNFAIDSRGNLETTFGPEDVFYYAYAVFHSPTYRFRYAEFLKMDFPRLPLTSDQALFVDLAAKGEELAALHLMESKSLDNLITAFKISGSNKVAKVRYADNLRRVYINDSQYFEGVPPEVWEFQVGGYQVCRKWLQDRKGRKLEFNDLMHYQKIVVALKETIRLMAEIDEMIPEWPIS